MNKKKEIHLHYGIRRIPRQVTNNIWLMEEEEYHCEWCNKQMTEEDHHFCDICGDCREENEED
jgi:rRNA maturation endonuclease Nob1